MDILIKPFLASSYACLFSFIIRIFWSENFLNFSNRWLMPNAWWGDSRILLHNRLKVMISIYLDSKHMKHMCTHAIPFFLCSVISKLDVFNEVSCPTRQISRAQKITSNLLIKIIFQMSNVRNYRQRDIKQVVGSVK